MKSDHSLKSYTWSWKNCSTKNQKELVEKSLYLSFEKSHQGIEKCWRKLKNLFDLKKHHRDRDRGKFLDHFLFFGWDQRFDFYDRFIKNHLKTHLLTDTIAYTLEISNYQSPPLQTTQTPSLQSPRKAPNHVNRPHITHF